MHSTIFFSHSNPFQHAVRSMRGMSSSSKQIESITDKIASQSITFSNTNAQSGMFTVVSVQFIVNGEHLLFQNELLFIQDCAPTDTDSRPKRDMIDVCYEYHILQQIMNWITRSTEPHWVNKWKTRNKKPELVLCVFFPKNIFLCCFDRAYNHIHLYCFSSSLSSSLPPCPCILRLRSHYCGFVRQNTWVSRVYARRMHTCIRNPAAASTTSIPMRMKGTDLMPLHTTATMENWRLIVSPHDAHIY